MFKGQHAEGKTYATLGRCPMSRTECMGEGCMWWARNGRNDDYSDCSVHRLAMSVKDISFILYQDGYRED